MYRWRKNRRRRFPCLVDAAVIEENILEFDSTTADWMLARTKIQIGFQIDSTGRLIGTPSEEFRRRVILSSVQPCTVILMEAILNGVDLHMKISFATKTMNVIGTMQYEGFRWPAEDPDHEEILESMHRWCRWRRLCSNERNTKQDIEHFFSSTISMDKNMIDILCSEVVQISCSSRRE